MSTPAKQGSARPDDPSKTGNPSDSEPPHEVHDVDANDQDGEGDAEGDADGDGEGDEEPQEEGESANTNVLEYLKRNTHMKAVDMFERKRVEEQQAQAQAAGTAGETEDKPRQGGEVRSVKPAGAVPTTANSASTAPRQPLPTPDEGLPAKDLIKRNLPQAQASSASTSAYYLSPDFIAQAEDLINRHKAGAAANAAATNTSIAQATGTGQQGGVLLDTTDRLMGYSKVKEWVEAGLEGWKVSSKSRIGGLMSMLMLMRYG